VSDSDVAMQGASLTYESGWPFGFGKGLGTADPLGGQQEPCSFKQTFLEMDSFIKC